MSTESAPAGTAAPAVNPAAAMTLQGAVAALEARRQAAAAPAPVQPAEAPKAEAEPSQPEADNAASDLDQAAPAADAEPATDEPTEAPDGDDAQPDESDDEGFLVELPDGQQISLKELTAGYMKDADYRKKTAAVAEERRALQDRAKSVEDKEGELNSAVKARIDELTKEVETTRKTRSEYEQVVKTWNEQLAAADKQWKGVDWERLAEEDPKTAQKLWMQREQHREQMEVAKREAADLAEQRRAEAEKDIAEKRSTLQKHVATKYPELTNAETGNAFWGKMVKFAQTIGYTEDDIRSTLDPRGVDLLIAATRYHDTETQRAAAIAADPAKAPKPDQNGKLKIIKQGNPRPRPIPAPKAALGRAQAAFNGNPSMENAIALREAKRAAGR